MSKHFNKQAKKKNCESHDSDFDTSKKGNWDRRGNKKRFSKDEASVGRNDVSWYTPDAELLNSAGRWPYSIPVGTPLRRRSILNIADNDDNAVPGICCADVYIVPGHATGPDDALNVASDAAYTFIRHANSGSRNYNSPDLMLNISAMDSIYCFVSWITRAFATIPMYASMNKYLPEALAEVQNLDLDSIRTNMANFRTKFNTELLKIGTLLVPDTMPIFKRHAFMFQNYYSEGPSIKDQLYFYTLKNVYQFQLDSSGAGMLKNIEISDYYNSAGKLDANGILQILEDLINPIFNNEDFNIMTGDILKAYGDHTVKMMLLPELIVAQPINNIVFLEQFKNMRTLYTDFPTTSGVLDIKQDVNKKYLQLDLSDFGAFQYPGATYMKKSDQTLYPEHYKLAYDEMSRDNILTTEITDVSPEINMLNTRCMTVPKIILDPTAPSGLEIDDITFGSEIISRVWYAFNNKNFAYRASDLASVVIYDKNSVPMLDFINELQNRMASFRFHPAHTFIGIDTATTPPTYITSGLPNLGIDNFSTIDYAHVKDLHDVAILGEYNVPRLAVVK